MCTMRLDHSAAQHVSPKRSSMSLTEEHLAYLLGRLKTRHHGGAGVHGRGCTPRHGVCKEYNDGEDRALIKTTDAPLRRGGIAKKKEATRGSTNKHKEADKHTHTNTLLFSLRPDVRDKWQLRSLRELTLKNSVFRTFSNGNTEGKSKEFYFVFKL